jgi:16S rRNA (cytidine1402-2'-O)-methyltransferase
VVRRGPLASLVEGAADGVRGEVTIVVTGAVAVAAVAADPDSYRAAVADLEATGTPRKEAIVQVARLAGVPKREVYDAVHVDRGV